MMIAVLHDKEKMLKMLMIAKINMPAANAMFK
jgi:hypothetical protein